MAEFRKRHSVHHWRNAEDGEEGCVQIDNPSVDVDNWLSLLSLSRS